MATFITLLLVPVLYSIFVLDLKIVPWESKQSVKTIEVGTAGERLAKTN